MFAEPSVLPGLVVFRLGEHRFGIELPRVVELLRMVAVTPVPEAPRWLLGAINLRGSHVPAIDLRTRLGLAVPPPGAGNRIVVVETRGRKVCLVVDQVDDVVGEGPDKIEQLQNLRGDNQPVTRVARIRRATIMILEVDEVAGGTDDLEMPEVLRAGA